jgi:formylglycine-generating enzyme required for sulfatase activity
MRTWSSCAGVIVAGFLLACCSPNREHEIFSLSLSVEGNGSVAREPDNAIFYAGSRITLTAIPDSGWLFVGWFGDFPATENPHSFAINHDLTISAHFMRKPADAELAFVPARDSGFSMGSNAAGAGDDERPAHAVRFTYDYFIGVHEVTQEEFRDVMGYDPASSAAAGRGDSFPVFNLTWYEAALYCNAKSKAAGYDTVYAYTAQCPAGGNCPYVLENLTIRYDAFGYRLPTEAEWEYACRAHGAADYWWGAAASAADSFAWYNINSGDHAHAVNGRRPNAFRAGDMAGNVAEWVNDWLGAYGDSAVVDPVGPRRLPQETFENSWERPIRGGSFRLGSSFLRSSCRRGPYATSARAVQDDIGFRVALGAFFPHDAVYHEPALDSLDLRDLCLKSALISFIGTTHVKLVFVRMERGARQLWYIDFSEPAPMPRLLADTMQPHQPVISPDGRFVAYSSLGEGYMGRSQFTVRALDAGSQQKTVTPQGRNAFLPRWWVDRAAGDTSIIYTDGASLDNTVQWSGEQTWIQDMAGGAFNGEPRVLWPRGSYHGGRSSDGRFLGTGYPKSKLVDMGIPDTNLPLFIAPYNGRDDNPQTCNLSMSPSLADPGDAMLLDFGYPRVSTLVGASYGFHAVIFICTPRYLTSQNVKAWFMAPQAFGQWDDVEYTNHPRFGAAMARTEGDAASNTIYCIDLADSAYLRIAAGTDIREPWLWIDPADVAEVPDPYAFFGQYDLPVETYSQTILAQKLRLFWKRCSQADCIIIGGSEALCGVDPASMSGFTALNCAHHASNMPISMYVATRYALTHAPGLRAVVVDLLAGFLGDDAWKPPARLSGWYDSKGFQLDSANDFWRSGIPQNVAGRIAMFDSSSWPYADANGYPRMEAAGGWGDTIIDGRDYSLSDSLVRVSLGCLRTIVDAAAAESVAVLAVNFPENPLYRMSSMAGRYGPSPATYDSLTTWLSALASSHPNFHFYDANDRGLHDYTSAEAQDCDHLDRLGAAKLSARIDSVLRRIVIK